MTHIFNPAGFEAFQNNTANSIAALVNDTEVSSNAFPQNGIYLESANTLGVTTAGVNRGVFTPDGKLVIGANVAIYPQGLDASMIQAIASNTSGASITAIRYGNTNAPSELRTGKSRSDVIGGVEAVREGDLLSRISAFADSGVMGNGMVRTMNIDTYAGPVAANSVSSYMKFQVTSNGASTPTTRMILDSGGNLVLGSTDAPVDSAKLNIVTGSSHDAIRITQTGTGNAFVVEDTTNPDPTSFIIDNSGRVIAGANAIVTMGTSSPTMQINTNGAYHLDLMSWNGNSAQSALTLGKSRGNAPGIYAPVQNGDYSAIDFRFDDGNSLTNIGARLMALNEGTATVDNVFAGVSLQTRGVGETTSSSKFRISANGFANFGAGAATQGVALAISRTLTGATTSMGAYVTSQVQPDVTGASISYRSSPTVINATFKLSQLTHFFAAPGAFGTNAVVNQQFGFITGSLNSATENYGYNSTLSYTNNSLVSSAVSTIQVTNSVVTVVTSTPHGISTGTRITVDLADQLATEIVVGRQYTIKTVGTTDYTAIGAFNNIVGTIFTATAVGTGSGTVALNFSGSNITVQSVVNPSTFTYIRSSPVDIPAISITGTVTPNRNYNIFSVGTADNYFGGNVGLGTTAPSARMHVVNSNDTDALRITQTGNGNVLVVEDATSPDSTPLVVDNNGNVTIGLAPNSAKFTVRSAPISTISEVSSYTVDHYLGQITDSTIGYVALSPKYISGSVSASGFDGEFSVYRGSSTTLNVLEFTKVSFKTAFQNSILRHLSGNHRMVEFTVGGVIYIGLEITGTNSSRAVHCTGRYWGTLPVLHQAAAVSNVVLYSAQTEVQTMGGQVIVRTAGTQRMMVDGNGLAVGVSSPLARTHSRGLDINGLRVDSNLDTVVAHRFGNTAAGVTLIANKSRSTSSDGHAAVLANDTLYTIASHGSDGGAYRRAAQIDIISASNITSTSSPGHITLSTTPVNSVTPVENMRLTANGDVGIGTSSPAAKLHVVGSIVATGDITASFASDRNLKTDIVKIDNALAKVHALNGYTYSWNELAKSTYPEKGNEREVGVIAQEVEAVIPELVITRDNGYKAVHYEKMIAVLIEAVKELSAEVNELKSKM